MKIKFDADNDLPLNKLLKLRMLTIIVNLFLKKTINFIRKFIQMGVCMNLKNASKHKANEN